MATTSTKANSTRSVPCHATRCYSYHCYTTAAGFAAIGKGLSKQLRTWIAAGWALAICPAKPCGVLCVFLQAQLQHTLIGHRWTVSCLSFHPAARMLASGSFDRTIRIWDTNDGKVRPILVYYAW